MNIPINKDFEAEYKNNAWKGFSLHELKYIVGGIAVAAIGFAFLFFVIRLYYQLAIALSLCAMIPVMQLGFKRTENGLSTWQALKAKEYRENTSCLLYKAEEYEPYEPREIRVATGITKEELKILKRKYRKYIKAKRRRVRREMKQSGVI